MKTYNTQKELDKDTVNHHLIVDDDIKITFNCFLIGNLTARNIKAYNIRARNIDAHNINACNINALNIDARDINAQNINAHHIVARDINAHNIDACDIKAFNIDYYAFCIAYQSFICVAIRGRRNNHIHTCLDGEIEYINEHTIAIDGKAITLSEESYQQLKKELT